jgi:hypothetical protein
MTEFEQSGKLKKGRGRMRKGQGLLNADFVAANLIGGKNWEPLIDVPLALPGLVMERRAYHDYRTWTLEQRIFQPDTVLQAWRHASSGPVPIKV